uniref:Uncharacterized protein n=1 Tax=Rhizophora mucronata TaxID=61149 RepID=A0A2P2M3I0_RHIMU
MKHTRSALSVSCARSIKLNLRRPLNPYPNPILLFPLLSLILFIISSNCFFFSLSLFLCHIFSHSTVLFHAFASLPLAQHHSFYFQKCVLCAFRF